MVMAKGSESYLAILAQDPEAAATIPANPVLQMVNFTKEDLAVNKTTKTSDHIRPDRMTTDISTTGFAVGGGYTFEMQYENSLLDNLIAGFMWSEWEAGGSLTSIIKNGKTYLPFYIERGHTDVEEYFKFIGMACNVWEITLEDQADVIGNYQFVGLNAESEEEQETGATYVDPTENEVFSTVTSIPAIKINGTPQSSCLVKSLSMTVNNNVTPKTGLGVLGACDTNAHRLSITGKLTMYFESSTMYKRFLNGEAFSISWTFQDSAKNTYIFTLPKVKIDADSVNVEGIDADVMDNATYVALADSVSGCMLQIEKGVVA